MDDAWLYHLFLHASGPCASLEQCLLVMEHAMPKSRVLLALKVIQAATRRKKITLRELQSAMRAKKNALLLNKSNNTVAESIPPVLTGSQAIKRILVAFRLEFRALEMDSRHAFAYAAQIVAAIKPQALLLNDTDSASRLRHEMFVEKVSTEPGKHFARANVDCAATALDRILVGGFRKELTFSTCLIGAFCTSSSSPGTSIDGKLPSTQSRSTVFLDGNLSDRVLQYVSVHDLLRLGICARTCVGARERAQVVWARALIEDAARRRTGRDHCWMEAVLHKHTLSAEEEAKLREHVSSQRALADCIIKLNSAYFPPHGDVVPLSREVCCEGKEKIGGFSVASSTSGGREAGPSSFTAAHRGFLGSDGLLITGDRINTAKGLFVVRKSSFPEFEYGKATTRG